MPLLVDLVRLQDVDSRLDASKATLEDVRSRFGDSEEIAGLQEEIAGLETELGEAQREARDVETEIGDRREKVEHEEQRLYDGSVRNPKELSAIQNEVQSLKEHLGRRDEVLLSLMSRIDELNASLTEKRAQIEQLRAEWKEEQETLRRRETELEAEIGRQEAERVEAAAAVPPATLTLYDQIRRRRAGQAMAKVERSVCMGCRITLPAAVIQRSRNLSAIVHCPSCERILYQNL